ncbi:uncharacterized protein LOC132176530 [Corylus avellana]|uniref:uncharacterized protein LOC132176530 n=1 Tax=Corylus avellana TaxID=13451 RepID=UPI00286CD6CD|nr:uncharacterized protein LOC132176530 [Corylus avellana]
MSASFSHFFKRLSYTLPRRRLIHPSPSPLTLFLATDRVKEPSSCIPRSLTAKLSTSSCTPTKTESFTSSYLSVHIRCPKEVADMLSEALLCFGASSITMDEEDASENSDKISMDSIFPEGKDVNVCISRAAKSIGLKEIPHYDVKMGEQSDWIRKTQESFHPVEVTEGVWVVPEWITPPDVQATNIILNPGLAFGTGEHPTTKMCLLLLHSLIKGGELVLDYGTGSGVLAVAAVKFGAALSVGIDVDPQAITSACQNASLNNIRPEKMQLHLVPGKACPPSMNERTCGVVEEPKSNGMGFICGTEQYDVVIANILLNPLLELADNIVSYAKHGSVVGLSGILSEQVPYIIERYSPFLEGISVSEMDDWACVSGRKKRKSC